MFAKNKVSQSLIDAVNKIMSEKEVESKEQFLSEGWDEMLKSVKDKNKPQPSGGAGKKQGSRYGGSKQKEEPEEKEVKEQYQNPLEFSNKPKRTHSYDGMPDPKKRPKYDAVPTSRQLGSKPQPKNEELKGNQHKIDKNKNNKIDAEDFKMLRKEELKGDQHKIDANKNNKIDAHDFQLLRGKKKVKEDTFAAKLLNSLSEKEGTGASDPLANRQDYAKRHGTGQVYKKTHVGDKTGMSQAYAYDIKRSGPKGKLPEEVELDETRGAQAMKASGVKQSPDKLLHRTGMNNAHKFPRAGQTDTSNIPGPNTGKPMIQSMHKLGAKWRLDRKAQLKPAIKAALGTHGPKGKLPEEVELNEVSKSEVDHHYDDWINSSGAPYNKDAGDEKKVHDSAMRHLRNKYPPIPKEKHEKLAMHMAHLYHGSGIDEAAPKKMDDVAKQNLTPAKKGVVDTVKSDFKNFKSFLAGKKETNEAISSNKQTIDTLAGRSKKVPKEAKIDNDHSSAKVELKSEEVEQLDEDRWLMKYLLSRGINPQFVSRNQKVAHAKSNDFKKYRRDHQQEESVQTEAAKSPIFRPKPTDYNNATKARARRNTGLPFAGPYAKVSADPMQRARSMAQSAMQSVKDKQNQPTTMDKVKSAVDTTKKVATKTFMTAFKP